jgi:hypothetical protein
LTTPLLVVECRVKKHPGVFYIPLPAPPVAFDSFNTSLDDDGSFYIFRFWLATSEQWINPGHRSFLHLSGRSFPPGTS